MKHKIYVYRNVYDDSYLFKMGNDTFILPDNCAKAILGLKKHIDCGAYITGTLETKFVKEREEEMNKPIPLYYQSPSDEIFNEVKAKAIELWKTYDNSFGYVDEKTDMLIPLKNIRDNIMHIISMFDSINRQKLAVMLSDEAREAVRDRLKSVNYQRFNTFA